MTRFFLYETNYFAHYCEWCCANLSIDYGMFFVNTGCLKFISSKDDNLNDKSLVEGTDINVLGVGMKFKYENEVFEFYKVYAYQFSFSVRERNLKKGDDGVVHYITFTCSQEGHRTSGTSSCLKPQPTMRLSVK